MFISRFPFVGDHLLFFTVLFQEFLPRVFRMDLCATKNAFMLFRVSKVFNLPNLSDMIKDGKSQYGFANYFEATENVLQLLTY